jgi:hypothetical protein
LEFSTLKITHTLVGLSACALLAGTASADFVGLSVENATGLFTGGNHFGANQANVEAAWNTFTQNGTDPKTVWRIYADFDNANDFLLNIGIFVGSPPLHFNVQGTVYSQPGTGVLAPDAALLANPATANAAFDSFATIGLDVNNGNDQTQWGPFQMDIHGMFNQTSPLGDYWADQDSWGVNVGDPQSQVVAGGPAGYRVLLAQIVVQDGANISGTLAGQWGSGSFLAGEVELENFVATFNSIPAPGAVALLLLAGVCTKRRRR